MFDVAVTYIQQLQSGQPHVLLGEKLTGLGVGNIVGPGGKAEPGETPQQTAVREVWEEVGLVISEDDLVPIATITYPFLERDWLSQRSFVFACHTFTGTIQGSTELAASWWPIDRVPYERMWADAKLWLPRALEGSFVSATFEIGLEDEVVSIDYSPDH
jgi:8-oxo-dGTP diphosphatase